MAQTEPAPAVKKVPSFWRRWTIRAVIALGALTIFGFFAAPPLVKHFVTKKLSQALQRPVSVEKVQINPFTLRTEVQGIAMGERGSADTSQPVLSVASAVVNVEMESLFKRAPVVSEITLDQPRVKIVRTGATRINFSDLIDQALAAPPSPEPARFALFNITVRDGTIEVDDQTVKKQHKVSGIELGVPFISNLATYVDVNVEPRFAATINGTPLALKGSSKPFAETREAALDLNLAAFPLAPWMAYLPQTVPVVLTDGRLQTNLTLVFAQPPKAAPKLLIKGTAQLNDIKASERGGAALGQVASVTLILDSVEPLAGKFVLKSLYVGAPQIAVTREANGVLNLQRLADAGAGSATTTPTSTSTSPPPTITLGELLVSDAQVDWRDEAVKPAFAGRAQFNKLEVRNFSSTGGTASYDVQGIALGAKLASSGEFSLGGNEGEVVSARGTASLAELALKQLAPYSSPLANLDIDSGTLGGKTRFNLSVARDLTLTLTETQGELASLKARLRGEKEPLLSAQSLAAKGVELDLRQRKVSIADVALGGVSGSATRGKDGTLNWQKFLPPPAKSAAPAKPWNVAVKQVSINQTSLRFTDDAVAPPVVSVLELQGSRINNLATAPGSKVELALKGTLNKTGRLGIGGTASLQPLAANLRLDIGKLGVTPFEPYFADALNIKLQSADVNARGTLDVTQDAAGMLNATYAGDLNLTDLQTQTIESAEDFLRWKSLSLSTLKANAQLKAGGGVESWALDLGEVALADFYSRLIIYPSGRLNLQDIVKNGSGRESSGTIAQKPATSAALAATATATDTEAKLKEAQTAARNALTALPVKIGRISLTAGNVNFSDRFIKPNYSANLTNLGGSVGALAADGTPADVDLRGTVDNTAPLKITGKLNPLGRDLFLDLKAAVSDVELPTLSPYAAKYAGYGIEKGKLAMDVSYLIEGGKLTAQNRVVLDQLTFGPKVESPDATKLPVLLAVALLTDSKGRIDINLPVTGSLNDPQFSVGGIIIQVIVNLIGKALTAPFALLGAAFGGGDELAFIEFAPGSSTLDASADKKLATLTKAMNDRPALRLDLAGRVDPTADREGARRSNLEAKLLAAHSKAGGGTGSSLAALPAPEREKLLKAVYDAADFPKPRNVIGLARSLPADDMEKLLLTHTPVSDEDLRMLANARAQRVKDALSKGGIKPERLFLVANAAAPNAKGAPTRVDLTLKQ